MTAQALRALIVEDSEDDAALIARELQRAGYDLVSRRVETADDMREALEHEPWDIVIADFVMPAFDGLGALRIAKQHDADTPFIIVSGTIGEDVAVDAMRAGAHDYIMKGSLARLAPAVERELREAKHRRAGKAAQEAVTRLATAVEQTAEGVVITDLEGTIQYVNTGFERASGYGRDEAVGQNIRLLKSGVQDQSFYEALWCTIQSGKVWRGRFVNKKKDGTHYQEEVSISPIRDDAGRIVNFVSVHRDVTRERMLEADLRQAQKMEAVGQLAGGVAHDFNNLLTAIFGYTSLARDSMGENPVAIKMLSRLEQAAEQAAGITRSLLTFSRKTSVEKKPVDLHTVLTKSARLLRHVLPDAVEVITDADDSSPAMVNADESQIQQIIVNLAINARDAMPKGGTLRIALRGAGDSDRGQDARTTRDTGSRGPGPWRPPDAGAWVCLSVSDTGTGIPAELRERIFEPFFTTKPKGEGTGLGLSIIHGIVKDHKGTIGVDSVMGEGTTFTVSLPALSSEESVRPAALPIAPRGRGELILLAEDNRSVRGILTASLQSLNYDVIQAADGGELRTAFARYESRLALLVIDLGLPIRGGLGCLRDIRSAGSQTPAILITADVETRLNNELDPHTSVLRKPFSMTDFGVMCGRALGALPRESSEVPSKS